MIMSWSNQYGRSAQKKDEEKKEAYYFGKAFLVLPAASIGIADRRGLAYYML